MRIVVAFLLGLLNIVMAILRGRWTHIAFTSPDFCWHWALVVLLTDFEKATAHICVTLPVIIMWLWGKLTGSFNTQFWAFQQLRERGGVVLN
jgi:hypothetical protein